MADEQAITTGDETPPKIMPPDPKLCCDICDREISTQRTAVCASCAKATLYESRVEQARSLVSREKSHLHAEAVVRPGNDGVLASLPEDADWDAITAGIKTHGFEKAKAEHEALNSRIRDIQAKAEELRQNISEYKTQSQQQKETIGQRRKDLSTKRTQLAEHKARALEPVHLTMKKAKHRLEKIHKRTMDAREHLCLEVAVLSGLKKVKRDDGRSEFRISTVPILDLRDLISFSSKSRRETIETPSGKCVVVKPHEMMSASLDSLCRFLGICCHYLSIRLPCEIIMPHNNFPHAAVLSRENSYRYNNLRYPGFGSSQSSTPAASRILQKTPQKEDDLPRPRVLQIDRPLVQLQKEDPKSASLFLEGVSYLAYDLAWLCKSQGMGPFDNFEDFCRLGRNVYDLVYHARSRNAAQAGTNNTTSASTTQFGDWSHDSVHHNLATHEGLELFKRSFAKVSPTFLANQLTAYLRDEAKNAEWHVLGDSEWNDARGHEQPVLVGGAPRRSLEPSSIAMSVMSVRPSDGTDEAGLPTGHRGNNGWMKVRGRGGEN